MHRMFRTALAIAVAIVAMGTAADAFAQSTADAKRTLKHRNSGLRACASAKHQERQKFNLKINSAMQVSDL